MAVQESQLIARIGRIQAGWRNKPNSVQTFDNPWYEPGKDTPEMFAVKVNGAGLVVRAIAMSLSGERPSLQTAMDEAAVRHTTGETILAEWMDSLGDPGMLAAELVIRFARARGEQPDESWQGAPTHTIYSYPERLERWANAVTYDSGRSSDEGLDWDRAFESIDEARAAFQMAAHR